MHSAALPDAVTYTHTLDPTSLDPTSLDPISLDPISLAPTRIPEGVSSRLRHSAIDAARFEGCA